MSDGEVRQSERMTQTQPQVARLGPRRLLIVSHAPHFEHAGQLGAYGPYAREIDIWADLFETVVIAAPFRKQPLPGDCVPFTRHNISVVPQYDAGGNSIWDKLGLIVAVPVWFVGLARAMRHADAIHVRCPGNIGLVGAILAPLFSPRIVAKYAGQWNGYAGEPVATRLQRWVLGSSWWRGPVTVYGEWPDQPEHIVPFFTSMMTSEQVERAAHVAASKHIDRPLRVLYSGTLEARKRVDALIDAVALLVADGIPVELVIVGHGPLRAALQTRAATLEAQGHVRFIGSLPYDESLRWFEWAHALVLPSQHSEGWPKVIAEGMCHGLLCVAVAHGQVPRMLTDRGVLLPTGSPEEIARALAGLANAPEAHRTTMRAAAAWARQFSLDGLQRSLRGVLAERWGLGSTTDNAIDPLGREAR